MEELLAAELEALVYTYGTEAVQITQQAPLHITVNVAPHTGDLATERYVTADLALHTSSAYPEQAPVLRLKHAQGLSDARTAVVMSRLHAEASNLVGEMMLGSLVETAKDVLTGMNYPEGNCIFCLESLAPAGWDASKPVHGMLRLPCYHTFHQNCFSRWWQWQQESMAQQAAQIKADLQSAAPQRLEADGLIPDGHGAFSVQCPVCRLLIHPPDLQHMTAADRCPDGQHQLSASLQSATSLTPAEMHHLKTQQQIRAEQFARQQQQGGIVSERWGTSIDALALPDQSSVSASTSTQAEQAQQCTQQQNEAAGHQHQVPMRTQGRKHDSHYYRGQGRRSRGRHHQGRGRGQRTGNAPVHEVVH